MDELVYIVPWVQGPGGFERPFGLDTKYGHLVFVFRSQGDLYDAFFHSSAGTLREGYTLETTAVVVPNADELTQELAARMPSGRRFGVAVEGTDEFSRFIAELADDTIWSDA